MLDTYYLIGMHYVQKKTGLYKILVSQNVHIIFIPQKFKQTVDRFKAI